MGGWAKGRKAFFSEEKKQKTFLIQVYVPLEREATAICKSHLVLFFRKEHFFGCPRVALLEDR
jgi:hypothetical protein